ncbi:NADP-dependent oxidoreductase [Salegentibacter sp. F188]|uniref:NADP-dependent oxidoreductase n=1 Tax=Autumnicola patrickiae TaxID=3075591 RepID=A0ABU3E2B1_9FLAO|nr:NADP-dependent oxidoreductase [Salegentibacter sp. F188]MDT0690091.1 NADP-dependent oxidoreductase [Salegentibacter sp. F188]
MMKYIILRNRPEGKPSLKDFGTKETEKPQPGEGEILLKALYVSVDPYLRGRMRDEKSYIPPFKLNEPMESMVVPEVEDSKNENFSKGDFVSGMLDWQEYQVSDGKGLNKINKDIAPLSAYLGILGLTGITAYLGLEKIGKLKEGETLLVSGAAGAVGSIVGQIGKIKKCKVVGIAGSDEKIKKITKVFKFDEGINYKTTDNIKEEIKKACPNGVDVYFDNVGGEMLDAAILNMNKFGRVVNCGAISLYNSKEKPTGLRLEPFLIKKSILMQGFTVRDYAEDFQPAIKQLSKWLKEDKLQYEETIVEGFEKIPQAFLDLFEGKNQGKMVVKV